MKKFLALLSILLLSVTLVLFLNKNAPTGQKTSMQSSNSISIDLNNDNSAETLELSKSCGTSGCNLQIYTNQHDKVSEINLVQAVYLSTTTSQGWTDLVIETYGGGAPRVFYKLEFNGSTYPFTPYDGTEIDSPDNLTPIPLPARHQ